MLRRFPLALFCACLTLAPAAAARAGVPSVEPKRPALVWVSNERTRTAWAYVDVPAWVRSAPRNQATRRDRLRPYTFYGQPERVLVLARTRTRRWTLIRYSGLGSRRGWVPTGALSRAQIVTTRLVIDRSRTQIKLFDGGRRIFQARIGVGAGESPTPAGRYYIREVLQLRSAGTIYGVRAFGTSAYSRYRTDWPGGGQVGVHGTNQPQLIPGHISNGCIRLRNPDVLRLARLLPLGTPVLIV